MKYLLSICLIWLNVILISCIIIAGCASTPQPIPHSIEGDSVLFVPEGCRIGDVVVPEDGIYIGESKLIEAMIQERQKEEQRKRQRRL